MKKYKTAWTEKVAQLTIEGRERAITEGRVVGAAPLGYLNHFGEPGGKTAIIDIKRAPLIAYMFCLAAEGQSLRTIVRSVQSLGLCSRDGKPISLSSVYEMLGNPFYAGWLRYKGQAYAGNHQPLISAELFDRAYRSIQARSKSQRSVQRETKEKHGPSL